jgi:hypothetical protein
MTDHQDHIQPKERDPQIEYGHGVETIIFDLSHRELGRLQGVALMPPPGSIIEFGNPNRDGIVREVHLRASGVWLSIVYVQVLDRTVPPPLR